MSASRQRRDARLFFIGLRASDESDAWGEQGVGVSGDGGVARASATEVTVVDEVKALASEILKSGLWANIGGRTLRDISGIYFENSRSDWPKPKRRNPGSRKISPEFPVTVPVLADSGVFRVDIFTECV